MVRYQTGSPEQVETELVEQSAELSSRALQDVAGDQIELSRADNALRYLQLAVDEVRSFRAYNVEVEDPNHKAEVATARRICQAAERLEQAIAARTRRELREVVAAVAAELRGMAGQGETTQAA